MVIINSSITLISQNDPWIQINIPFTINVPTTMNLTFSMSSNPTQVWFSGVSITPVGSNPDPPPEEPPIPTPSSIFMDEGGLVLNGHFFSPDISTSSNSVLQISHWTKTGNNIGINDLDVAGITKVGLPSSITQAIYINQVADAVTRSISQEITFPSAGNYELIFYILETNSVNFLLVSLGSTILQTVSYPEINVWYKYVIPFKVATDTLIQTLKFQQTTTIFSNQMITGVSIYSKDYTLDLFLEWIPDENNNRIL